MLLRLTTRCRTDVKPAQGNPLKTAWRHRSTSTGTRDTLKRTAGFLLTYNKKTSPCEGRKAVGVNLSPFSANAVDRASNLKYISHHFIGGDGQT